MSLDNDVIPAAEQPVSYAALGEFFEQAGEKVTGQWFSSVVAYDDCLEVWLNEERGVLIRWGDTGWTVEEPQPDWPEDV